MHHTHTTWSVFDIQHTSMFQLCMSFPKVRRQRTEKRITLLQKVKSPNYKDEESRRLNEEL
jgi:hypothetical protein